MIPLFFCSGSALDGIGNHRSFLTISVNLQFSNQEISDTAVTQKSMLLLVWYDALILCYLIAWYFAPSCYFHFILSFRFFCFPSQPVVVKSKMSSGSGGYGGSRNFAGRKQDPIRNSFETIRTQENLAKPLQQQELRCKVCMEKVSGRPERLREHKTKCMSFPSQVRLQLYILDQWYNFVYQGPDTTKRVKLCIMTI